MLKAEIIILTNNLVIPFQNLKKDYGLDFIEVNKLFATQSIAEHGLGFLINIYDEIDPNDKYNNELIYKVIFDTGSTNLSFIHNLDVRGYSVYDTNTIVLSHWHYDHTGGLNSLLERIDEEVPIICHESAKYERFFRRTNDVKNSDLDGKSREEILPLLSAAKIVNQVPINLEQIKKLEGKVIFSKDKYELLNKESLNVIISGEIPRTHKEEEFEGFYSLQEGILTRDEVPDDKCMIFEYPDHLVLLNGCCHSGIMNTIDYVKSISDKPISHIIGGFHMASASHDRIIKTIDFLKDFQEHDKPLYLFPIHCSGEKLIRYLEEVKLPNVKTFNATVGTTFYI